MEYEYTELYYSTPVQVKYYNRSLGRYQGGIALNDNIITSEGDLVSIDSIIQYASLDGVQPDDAVVELSWKDLDDFILT